MIVAGTSVDVDVNVWVVRSLLLQEIIELGFEFVGLLFFLVGVDDLGDGHAADPIGEYCIVSEVLDFTASNMVILVASSVRVRTNLLSP